VQNGIKIISKQIFVIACVNETQRSDRMELPTDSDDEGKHHIFRNISVEFFEHVNIEHTTLFFRTKQP
jgi:hypothetical protein